MFTIVYYVLCICGLWVIVLDVPDVFVVMSLQIATSLTYIRKITCVAFQLVNTGFVVWWGSCSACCFDQACECVFASESYLYTCLFEQISDLPDVWGYEGESGPFFILPGMCRP